ncbi:MAG: DUF6519 domain-containing protein, partial [Thermoanaerobaculia bacterium]
DDPCDLAPSGGYRGLENRLYRLEVHTGGTLAAARFKWSRDNASVVSPVEEIAGVKIKVGRIGRDPVLRFAADNWVEILDDYLELSGKPGVMARIATPPDETTRTLTLDRDVSADFDATDKSRHTRVRLWNQRSPQNTLDANGLMAQTAGSWISLEDGVQAQLFQNGTDDLQTGDYWVFAARAVDGSVEALDQAEPRGIRHRYCQLAAIDASGDVHDCRPLWPSEGGCCCCTVEVGEGGDFPGLEEALASLKERQAFQDPVAICLLPGAHSLRGTVVVDEDHVTIRGCGPLTEVIGPEGKPAFKISGRSVRLENLSVTAAAGMPAVVSDGATDLEITGNVFRNDTARRSQSPTESGLILLEVGTRGARIAGNEIADGDGHGIAIAIGFHQDIAIAGNEIRGMAGCGIASVQSGTKREEQRARLLARARESFREQLSSQQQDEIRKTAGASPISRPVRPLKSPGSADGLRFEHNTIAGCVSSLKAEERDLELPYGGIVLVRVAHLQITDNRIQENGTVKSGVPVAGIYVRQCRGLIIHDNVVVDNGPAPDEEQPIPGLQGGILGLQLSVEIERFDVMPEKDGKQLAPLQPDGWPAASIQNNLVVAPRGLALLLLGIGPMQVTGNRLTSRDVLGELPRETKPESLRIKGLFKFLRYFGTVVIMNTGWPAYVSRQLLPWGNLFAKEKEKPPAPPSSGTPASNNIQAAIGNKTESFIVGGKVDFSNNQVHLDLVRGEIEFAIAAVGILTGDDLALQNNQTECTLFADILLFDTLAVAMTLRATGNGFTESVFGCALSLFAIGLLMCTATSNQGTHCINAYALDNEFAWLISRDNANLLGPQNPVRGRCAFSPSSFLKGPKSDES